MHEFLGVMHNMKCIIWKKKMNYFNTECTWSHYFFWPLVVYDKISRQYDLFILM